MSVSTEPWFETFRRYRESRGWSLDTATAEFIAHSPTHLPEQHESVRRTIIRWERGETKNPTKATQSAIAAMFDAPVEAFFPSRSISDAPARPVRSNEEWADLFGRLEAGDTSTRTLDATSLEVDRLATAYSYDDARIVLGDVFGLADKLVNLRGNVDFKSTRELYRQMGWLAALRACLLWDQRDEAGAHEARHQAIRVGEQIGDPILIAWGHEIASWIALTKGDFAQAIRSAQVGINIAPKADVAAQLYAQQAKAYSRMGDRHKTEVSLNHVREILDNIELPENMRNHFSVDPTKANFYAMDAYRAIGADDLASAMAQTVIMTSRAPDGTLISPMRLAEGLLTQAACAARAGSVDSAVSLASEALAIPRQSAPSLLMVAAEVAREVGRFSPETGAEFGRELASIGGRA